MSAEGFKLDAATFADLSICDRSSPHYVSDEKLRQISSEIHARIAAEEEERQARHERNQ
jgi:hypothetical protein